MKIELTAIKCGGDYQNRPTIAELVNDGGVKDIYIEQVREMADQAYKEGLNIDYYPTNFVVQDEILYYIDYECNEYMDEWSFENWGRKYWEKKNW